MGQTFFQIVLFLAGALIGAIVTTSTPQRAKTIAWLIFASLVITAGFWLRYELGFPRLPNALAERGGIIWDVSLYPNKELVPPAYFQSRVQGARNGLRLEWGVTPPRLGAPADFYSAAFAATPSFNAGLYCFVIEVDDGARLFVDGEDVRNAWWGHTPGAVYKTPITLAEGPHTILLYYYEEYENASLHLSWYTGVGPECATVGHPGVQ